MRLKTLYITLTALLLFSLTSNAQIVERSVEAIEYLQTNDELIYQNIHIPVLDITYHEFSSDSITWRKDFQTGDCYVRFANTTSNTTNPYTSKQGYHDDWWVLDLCPCSGGSSEIDTIIYYKNGVYDTITEGTATIEIEAPITITGTTDNTSTDTTHTHKLILYMGEVENVDTTAVVDGYVLKWNDILQEWIGAPDLLGGGASGGLKVKEQDGDPDVDNVVEIRIEDGHVTDEGAGAVSIDFTLEPQDGVQDFFRTDTLTVSEGNTFVTFDTPLPDADYIVDNAYALYSNGERQSLSYDSLTANGFRVLDVVDESILHYLVMRNLDTLGLVAADYGRVAASATDPTLGYLDAKVDDSTITVVNNELHVLTSAIEEEIEIALTPTVTTVNTATYTTLTTDDILLVTYTATGACAITLDTDDLVSGRVITIKATTGVITNNVTISTEGSELIDGSATFVLSSNYDAIDVFSDGTNWYIK